MASSYDKAACAATADSRASATSSDADGLERVGSTDTTDSERATFRPSPAGSGFERMYYSVANSTDNAVDPVNQICLDMTSMSAESDSAISLFSGQDSRICALVPFFRILELQFCSLPSIHLR